MKKTQVGNSWFFVDESGDPNFYDAHGKFIVGSPGCSPVLILGLLETADPEPIRKAMFALQSEIVNDPLFSAVPSIKKTRVAFHAKDDDARIRRRVFDLIATLNFKVRFAVARKTEAIFRDIFQGRPNVFYDHLVSYSFEKVLHRYEHNHICISERGSKARQAPLRDAIMQGRNWFNKNYGTSVETKIHLKVQQPNHEPCLSVIDYMNWAVHRAFTRGEMEYYWIVEDKVSLLVDLYDQPRRWYNRKRRFDISKVTPLQLDPSKGYTAWSRLSHTEG